MCAIAGLVDRRGADLALVVRTVEAMRQAMAHRGPDDEGLIVLGGEGEDRRTADGALSGQGAVRRGPASAMAVLAHQRLAVIDLTSTGHQPMATPDGRFWITYNGELYNYRALRDELERDGVRFRGTSDTEVLLTLFARVGPAAFARCRGMFAVAIWDAETATLWLARDRFGIKPLYYAQPTSDRLLFASEVKALLASDQIAPDPDPQAAVAFLRRGSLPSTAAFFRDVRTLPPGHWARWRGGEVEPVPYWSLVEVLAGPWRHVTPREAAARICAALDESVRVHLVSDVPVGVFLSGGLDSTAILAAVRRVYTGPLSTITVVAPGTALDEGALAREAASRFATEHTEIVLSEQDVPDDLDDFFAAMDVPTVDGLNTYLVARAAREAGLKVVLSGLGGDELLGGYPSFVRVPRAAWWLARARRCPGLLAALAYLVARLPLAAAPKTAALFRAARRDVTLDVIWRASRGLFSDAEIRALGYDGTAGDAASGESRFPGVADPVALVAACELTDFMTPQLLRDTDVFSLRWAVEVRTPFVDHLFFEAVRAAGRWVRGRNPTFKLALFRASRDLVPLGHLAHPKRGFFLPMDRWLRRAFEAPGRSPLGPRLAELAARPSVQPFVDRFLRGGLHWSRIWALYVLDRFSREFPRRWSLRSSSSTTTAGAFSRSA